jgi:hypothetical protein
MGDEAALGIPSSCDMLSLLQPASAAGRRDRIRTSYDSNKAGLHSSRGGIPHNVACLDSVFYESLNSALLGTSKYSSRVPVR